MNPPFHLVFCGTPQFAVPTLEALVRAGFEVDLVVTQPDKPKGRGMEMVLSPVKQSALAFRLPVAQPEKIKNNPEFRAQLEALRSEAIIVVGYGRIVPQWMIELPPLGNINLHASLLPKYRGAAPIQWAIASGETVTGVTIMRIDAGLDTGDILRQQEVAVEPEDTAETLAPKLAAAGAALMVAGLLDLRAGNIQPRTQDHAASSLAPILRKEDGQINFQRSAKEIYHRLRGFQPWPGVFTRFRGKQLVVAQARVADCPLHVPPGSLAIEGMRLFAACGESSLELLEVQPEGKRRMPARDFINGYRPQPGERLG
jgi:methionyl-tRNA formyltransferase